MIPIAFLTTPLRLPCSSRRNTLPSACNRRPVHPFVVPRMGMSVKTESLPHSQLRLEISVGAEECTAAWNTVVSELVKRSTINGFRKGRAPKQMVINEFGKERVSASACEEVIEKSIKKAIEDGKLTVIGQAQIHEEGGVETIIKDFKPDAPLTFNVKVDVWPDAVLTEPYENMEIEAEEVALDDALVDNALEELQKKESFSVLSPEGTKAELGKMVLADLDGFYSQDDNTKGEKLPELADGQSVEINMTEGQYMPGFVEGLIGASVGETRDVNVEFPMQNPRKELAGQKAIFEVKVHAIKDIVLPELDDDFAMKVSEDNTIEGLRKTIRSRLGTEAENAQEKNINIALDQRLASIVEVEIPETLVESQVQNKFATMLASFRDKGMSEAQVKAMVTKENYDLYKQRALPNVEKNLRVNFAVSKIAKENQLVVDKEEIDGQMELVKAELKGQPLEEEDKVRDQIESQLERELVLNLLKKTAKISVVPKKEEEKEEVPAPVEASA